MKRYALAVEVRNAEEDSHVTDLLDAAGLRWWHYIRGFWLIVTEEDLPPQSITALLSKSERVGGRGHFVLDADSPGEWGGAVSARGAESSTRFLLEDWEPKLSGRRHHTALSP